MNLQQLKVFLEVMRRDTLQEAADQLELTQPTVSFHLRKLEESLGVQLFRKQSRKLIRTEAAEELLPYARRVASMMEEAAERMRARSGDAHSRLKLGASYTPATYFLPPFLADYKRGHPDTDLLLTVKKADTILSLLRHHEIDVAIVSLPNEPEKGLQIVPLIEDELQLVMNPQHPLASAEPLSAGQLEGEVFLLHEQGSTSRQLAEEWAAYIGLQFQSVMELGAIETIKETLKFNPGIGVLPLRSVLKETAAGELIRRPLPGEGYANRRHICLAYRDEPIYAAHIRSFIEFIRGSGAPRAGEAE
ncbi:LysR family transcriptional regulator [Paenibacillus sp. MMS20-IR301]|uniref:LysR family transcriptional regulator n=1 Tax=Paenibacillus sp. MMS20-IR301 TaxID=2895946 RepID=UPI0028EC523D|nr:LysR family transcriptional regulator [Paenibacillus sp. MMS20-IR301]WNS46684.1 LysR family transcriptional regulator [Paenibacillus sp. MMS20-IR301]